MHQPRNASVSAATRFNSGGRRPRAGRHARQPQKVALPRLAAAVPAVSADLVQVGCGRRDVLEPLGLRLLVQGVHTTRCCRRLIASVCALYVRVRSKADDPTLSIQIGRSKGAINGHHPSLFQSDRILGKRRVPLGRYRCRF